MTLVLYCTPDLLNTIADWQKNLSNRQLSKHTIRAYNSDLNQFMQFMNTHLGDQISLNDLSETAIRDFRSWLTNKAVAGTKSSSRARSLAGIRNFFNWIALNAQTPRQGAASDWCDDIVQYDW